MRILVSAFALAPNTGSEPGVGWRWACELARDNEVTVITDPSRAARVEPVLAAEPVAGLTVVYWRPRFLRPIPLGPRSAHLIYLAWQFGLLAKARSLHRARPFELALHLTYGVFRHPCFLGYLGVPFVFGPVGGGEDAPWALKRSLAPREKVKEALRSTVNAAARFDPFLWLALRRTDLILAKTLDTLQALPTAWRSRAVVLPEIGIDSVVGRQPSTRVGNEPLRVLFAGRLIGWKGAHLALRAVAHAIGKGVPIRFTVVGSGPYGRRLRALAERLGLLAEQVHWHAHMPQADLFDLYAASHCFLFPSLHDSSGNVVLEAQSFGLPVICVDRGGPPLLVGDGAGRIVCTPGKTEEEVIGDLAASLVDLAEDEGLRQSMARAALTHSRGMSWRSRVEQAMVLARTCMPAATGARP